MEKTLGRLLVEYAEANDYDISIESLREILLECFPTVWEGDHETFRWRTEASRVVKIDDGGKDRYFSFRVCTYSGDNDPEDAGFCWDDFDEMIEVRPEEVRKIGYVPIK